MSTALTTQSEIIASLVINGDLSKLTPDQKVQYYRQFCERLGVDPISQPFKLLKLSGKETLYCDRGGAQQLSRVHKVSHKIVSREIINGIFVVTAQASSSDRETENIGAVPVEGLKGEALANAMMKAETKAKRRATLDLLGLGMLDETEVETIPNAQMQDIPHEEIKKEVLTPKHKHWNSVVKELRNATKTMEEMKTYFDISEDVEKQLTELQNQPA